MTPIAQMEGKEENDQQTYAIIGAAMEVHKQLGCGFLEPVYQEALAMEFRLRGLPYQREVLLPVFYKGQRLETYYKADFICFENIIVELKALADLTNIERAQILNYLKATGHQRGLLLNFGTTRLQFERFVWGPRNDPQMAQMTPIIGKDKEMNCGGGL